MRKKIISLLAVLTIAVSTCIAATAAENPSATKAELHSEGVIRYKGTEGSVVIDSADFYTLADQLDLFKVRAVKQLGVMGTYLTHSNGDVAMTSADGMYAVHKKPQAGEEVDPLSLDFTTILEGIAVSQSIPTDPAAYGYPAGTKLYKKADGTLDTSYSDGAEPISIQPADVGNLSAGTAAWVNGKLKLGTGADMAEMLEEASKAPGNSGGGTTKHSIASAYTLPEDVSTAIAYVVTTNSEGDHTGADPVFSVSSCQKLSQLYHRKYFRNGYHVRIALYHITGMPAGTVVKGSGGMLFY